MNAQPCVLLNGWPGVGKDTVAETLSLLIGDNKTSLLDWDKAQGGSFQPVPYGEEEVRKARDECFAEQVEHPSTLNKMVICTDCISDTPEGRKLAQDFEIVADRSKRLLIPINLECHVEENMRRLQEAERRVSMKEKMQSPMEARTVIIEGGKLFVFKQRQGLTINITRMPPHEAALQILSFIRDLIARLDHELSTEETTPLEAKEPAWA
ncbi:hypothetical protein SLS53_005465 [Cytospora paraplurivora]|uniref:Uncharacterized protein n=1 Tax=Cytospora paraplurivora TaxID=2898453 RepID=A0AAN9YFT0_9PEZI